MKFLTYIKLSINCQGYEEAERIAFGLWHMYVYTCMDMVVAKLKGYIEPYNK